MEVKGEIYPTLEKGWALAEEGLVVCCFNDGILLSWGPAELAYIT